MELSKKNTVKARKFKEQLQIHSMIIPGIVLVIIFSFIPMIGVIMAFQDYNISKGIFGSKWVDVYNFKVLFNRPDFWQATANTVIIAFFKILAITVLSIVVALLINEVQNKKLKKIIQTTIFLPYFLSWALLGNIMVEMFSYSGSFNLFVRKLGIEPQYWIVSNKYFRTIVVLTDVWKTLGYQVVVFLAAINTINPQLYEAAKIDGANEWQLCRHITIPGIMSIIVLMSILNIGNIMNAGFEQILVMYSPSVYETGDILDTMAYRIGLMGTMDYSRGAAIGLFKSAISCICFLIAYRLAFKVKNYKIF